jgi:hypothetical protein
MSVDHVAVREGTLAIDECAPGWASWMFATAPMVALLSAAFSVALAVLIVPLLDLTPLLVVMVFASTGRWRGVARTCLNIATAVAGVMVLEWACAYTIFALSGGSISTFFGAWAIGLLTAVWWVYPAQLVVLLVAFSLAAVASFVGVRKTGTRVGASPGDSESAAATHNGIG